MRLVLVALAAALLASHVSAQLLTDPVGDVKVDANGQGDVPVAAASTVDLVALELLETPDSFRFTVKVADLGDDGPRPEAGALSVFFGYDNVSFLAEMYRSPDNAAYFGSLYSSLDGQSWSWMQPLATFRDLANDTVWQDVPRNDLVGASGKTPGRGDRIVQIFAVGNTVSSSGAAVSTNMTDPMPDAGNAPAEWTVQYRGQDGLGASLASPRPFRSSNGEATTYEYQVTARLLEDREARFSLTAQEVPRDWEVALPGSLLQLGPQGQVSFPVRVTVPFAHTHGAALAFRLKLEEQGGPAWATLELGVHYTSIPQPAGHHPTVYLHSRDWSGLAETVNPFLGGATGNLYMNTLGEDPADTLNGVEGFSNVGETTSRWTWRICLLPQLAMGINMNLTKEGTFSIPVQTTRPLAQATFTGTFYHLGPGTMTGPWCSWRERTETVIATAESAPIDLQPNTPAVITGIVKPMAGGDHIPFEETSQMVLILTLTTQDPAIWGTAGPMIQPGAFFTLPLDEFKEAGQASFVDTDVPVMAPGFVTEPPTEESPAAGPAFALALVAVAFLLRRKHA